VSTRAETQIGPADPAVVENRDGGGRFVILCDHASNFIPPEYASLGLGATERTAHIAWDPGAIEVARELARKLDAPLVYATVSRLVVDCNRPPDAPDLIAATSETTAIPGNAAVSDAERRRRIGTVHAPYHAAIDKLIGERVAAGRGAALIAIHSYTPIYRGVPRPWEVGVIFDRDRRIADPLIAALKTEGLKVGVNEPYSPADRVYYTLARHAEARGLAPAMIEIRNDLIASADQQRDWARLLARMLGGLNVGAEAA
jgi:predicted N-formylglutamate amidohydrolase